MLGLFLWLDSTRVCRSVAVAIIWSSLDVILCVVCIVCQGRKKYHVKFSKKIALRREKIDCIATRKNSC